VFALFRRLVRGAPRMPPARRPPLEPDERVVAWAVVSESDTVIATNRGLWLPEPPTGDLDGPDGPDGPPGPVRLGWHEIHKAVWSGRQLAVTAAEVVEQRDGYALVADRPARTYVLLEPGDVPEQVRARVTGSVAYTQLHPVTGGGGVRVVARRVSGVDGVTWTVRAEPGTDVDSPAPRAALAELVAQGRGQLPGAPAANP
jgi:hypothetical protein